MEFIINDKLNKNKKLLNLVADKRYIKNENYINTIKNVNNIKLITPLRINLKTSNINNHFNNSLLKEQLIIKILDFFLGERLSLAFF